MTVSYDTPVDERLREHIKELVVRLLRAGYVDARGDHNRYIYAARTHVATVELYYSWPRRVMVKVSEGYGSKVFHESKKREGLLDYDAIVEAIRDRIRNRSREDVRQELYRRGLAVAQGVAEKYKSQAKEYDISIRGSSMVNDTPEDTADFTVTPAVTLTVSVAPDDVPAVLRVLEAFKKNPLPVLPTSVLS